MPVALESEDSMAVLACPEGVVPLRDFVLGWLLADMEKVSGILLPSLCLGDHA